MNINGFNIEVVRKNVKNINLKVYPDLKIKASIPENMDLSSLERLIIAKESWINSKIQKYGEQIRLTKRKYVSGEDHYLNGKRYILKVVDSNTPSVKKDKSKILLMKVRKSSSIENKEKLMNSFYKEELEKKLNKFISEYELKIGVKTQGFIIRKMKNKWGSCNNAKRKLSFNIDLAKKKDSEIKYVVIHELIHLLEPKHSERFRELVEKYCPKWEEYHESLNILLNENKNQ